MIYDLPKWWALLTYDGFNYNFNVTKGLKKLAEERIRVGKEEAGTSTFNQADDKFQENQDKAQNKASPVVGTVEGTWPDKPVVDHHDNLYSHPKHS